MLLVRREPCHWGSCNHMTTATPATILLQPHLGSCSYNHTWNYAATATITPGTMQLQLQSHLELCSYSYNHTWNYAATLTPGLCCYNHTWNYAATFISGTMSIQSHLKPCSTNHTWNYVATLTPELCRCNHTWNYAATLTSGTT